MISPYSSRLPIAVILLAPALAYGASVQCILGKTRCVKSQCTEIPSKQVITILDRCEEFTANDIGRVALRLSHAELMERSGGRITPLVRAWHAYDDLYDSPLAFERKRKAEDNYAQIKRACAQIQRDFYDDSKWTK